VIPPGIEPWLSPLADVQRYHPGKIAGRTSQQRLCILTRSSKLTCTSPKLWFLNQRLDLHAAVLLVFASSIFGSAPTVITGKTGRINFFPGSLLTASPVKHELRVAKPLPPQGCSAW
jgi:hypothetical protein